MSAPGRWRGAIGEPSAATLDALRTVVTLPGLTAPGPGEEQALGGEDVRLTNVSDPAVAAPTEPLPGSFVYSVPTDDFTAVNAYYHSDAVFRMVQGMGFHMAQYFDGTSFPVRVDHRATIGGSCSGGNCVNAQAPGNAAGTGSDGFRYALAAIPPARPCSGTPLAGPPTRSSRRSAHWPPAPSRPRPTPASSPPP